MSAKKKGDSVQRPLKKTEYELRFANREAEKGWTDLLATARNATTDAWEHLTTHPQERSQRCYPLRADYATATVHGNVCDQWQYKVTDGGRIWYCTVPTEGKGKVAGVVYLMLCAPGHPKGTEPA